MNSPLTRPQQIRKTKIVATIGPACDTAEMLKSMISEGMNVARLNLSHGTLEEHKEKIKLLRVAAGQLGTNIAIMMDTRGIEIDPVAVAVALGELLHARSPEVPGLGAEQVTQGK